MYLLYVLPRQDRIQLSQVVTTLTDAQSKDTLIEPEYYQYLLLLLLKVGKVSSKYNVGTISKASGQCNQPTTCIAGFIWKLFLLR